jgi:hypothetical protein
MYERDRDDGRPNKWPPGDDDIDRFKIIVT